jgi:hypothetical protein
MRRSSNPLRQSCPALLLALLAACGQPDPDGGEDGLGDGSVGDGGMADGGDAPDPPWDPTLKTDSEWANDDLDSLVYDGPSLEPDYNNLVPRDDVFVVQPAVAADLVVRPNKLVLPASSWYGAAVKTWSPGLVVVAAPSEPGSGKGRNPLGFARRVVGYTESVQGEITVDTVPVGLEELVSGDLQQTLDPESMVDVDLQKVDAEWLEWAASTLYVDAPVLEPWPEGPRVDEPPPQWVEEPIGPGNPLWPFKQVFRAVKSVVDRVVETIYMIPYIGAAAKWLISVTEELWTILTGIKLSASTSLSLGLDRAYSSQLFGLNYTKTYARPGRPGVELNLTGQGFVDAQVKFTPATQFGVKVPLIPFSSPVEAWVNVDTPLQTNLKLGVEIAAKIASADGRRGEDLDAELQRNQAFAGEVANQLNRNLGGDPDTIPAGGWKRTVWAATPARKVVMAGPVPVVLVLTQQLDVECGFALQARLVAELDLQTNHVLRFGLRFKDGISIDPPSLEHRVARSAKVTGQGGAQISCGLIPRVSVFAYDTIGLNAGVRASLVADASYVSRCSPDPAVSESLGTVNLGLYGSLGLQLGARLQTPGYPDLGYDVGPIEPLTRTFGIASDQFTVGKGLAVCVAACRNGVKDERETDVDCGGATCEPCRRDRACTVNSDCRAGLYCAGGICSDADGHHCGDGVQDADEAGIDCGGADCARCATGDGCSSGADCASGFCAIPPRSATTFGTCVDDHCFDFVRDEDEGGVDCGGATCVKCRNGTKVTGPTHCASGIWNGQVCVPSLCYDARLSPGETDVDCGGRNACRRCGAGRSCTSDADCSLASPRCEGTCSGFGTPARDWEPFAGTGALVQSTSPTADASATRAPVGRAGQVVFTPNDTMYGVTGVSPAGGEVSSYEIIRVTKDGTYLRFPAPSSTTRPILAATTDGRVFATTTDRVLRLEGTTWTPFAGGGSLAQGSSPQDASFQSIHGLAGGPNGSLYVLARSGLVRILANGSFQTLTGPSGTCPSANYSCTSNTRASSFMLPPHLHGVAVSSLGDVLIAGTMQPFNGIEQVIVEIDHQTSFANITVVEPPHPSSLGISGIAIGRQDELFVGWWGGHRGPLLGTLVSRRDPLGVWANVYRASNAWSEQAPYFQAFPEFNHPGGHPLAGFHIPGYPGCYEFDGATLRYDDHSFTAHPAVDSVGRLHVSTSFGYGRAYCKWNYGGQYRTSTTSYQWTHDVVVRSSRDF